MLQKTKINRFSLKQILLVCIATIICLATLGLGFGLGFGTGSKDSTPVQALQNENRVLPRGVTQVSAGSSHTMAIDNKGNLWAFGLGSSGQLGNMSTSVNENSTPINITAQASNPLNGKQIMQVSAEGNHTMAIDSQGNLWAFGANNRGQLGNMATTNSSTPINLTAQASNPLNGKQIVQVSASQQHTMAIDSVGNLWAFGLGGSGQLGNMSTGVLENSTPINITAQAGNALNGKQIVQVAAGNAHVLAIDSQGNLWVFGNASSGQLGNMSPTGNISNPFNLTTQASNPLNGKQIIQVSASNDSSMAIDSQGNMWTWGNGQYGQLGDMTTNSSSTPVNATIKSGSPVQNKQIAKVSSGSQHAMAIDTAGNLWAFGLGSNGRLGNNSTGYVVNGTPINVTAQSGNPLNGKQIVQVSASGSGKHTMAIDSVGNLWAFGAGGSGQLGNMSTAADNGIPINITAQSGNPLNGSQFGRMQVSAGGTTSGNGDGHTAAIDNQGGLWAWGYNYYGGLGNMSMDSSTTPINITAQAGNPLNGKQIMQVSVGGSHTMAIDSQGNLWAFGNNDGGKLGNMSTGNTNSTPINITAQSGNPLDGKQIIQVSAGYRHTAVIDSKGNLWVFGAGGNGQLGNMSTATTNSTPTNITAQSGNPLNGKQIIQVSAGWDHTTAIDSQGSLWTFGYNGAGQLGNMSTTQSTTPINITAQASNPLNGKQIMQVSANGSHTMAIDSQGNLWAFGWGGHGQLGNMSTNANNSTPINITTHSTSNPMYGKQIMQVSAGDTHTMTIDALGNLWAFGYNGHGQLGNMSTGYPNSTPINITAQSGNPLYGKQIVQVSAGREHTMAIDASGKLWAFGDNSYGKLGNISTTSSSTPINIQIPPQFVSTSATISGSIAARISVRTNFTTGWGTTSASGGAYTTWTANTLTSPDVAKNNDTQAGRIRYEFDAAGVDTITALAINGTNINLTGYSTLTLWNSLLYLRIISADANRRLIVEMDRINTDQLVTLNATTTKNVGHDFKYSNNSHLSSRMKVTPGSAAETTSLTHIFKDVTWNGITGTVNYTEFTFTSKAAFTKITLSRPALADITITNFTGSLAVRAPDSGLVGGISSSTGAINTIIIYLTDMERYEYTWTIETQQIIQVQQILNPPAGATAIANPALLTLNSSSGTGWADAALAVPANQFGKTFAGWYTHPDYIKGTQITTTEQLQQHIAATGGAVVFLYARWA